MASASTYAKGRYGPRLVFQVVANEKKEMHEGFEYENTFRIQIPTKEGEIVVHLNEITIDHFYASRYPGNIVTEDWSYQLKWGDVMFWVGEKRIIFWAENVRAAIRRAQSEAKKDIEALGFGE